jgi:ribosome-binding factor A
MCYKKPMTRRHRPDRDEARTPYAPFSQDEPGPRLLRLQHLLFEEVDRLFRLEVRDQALQEIAITSLHLSPDLRNAKVYYALRGQSPGLERRVREGLERVTPFLRARVAEALTTKRTPDLHFHRDRMAEASLRAEDVLSAERAAQRASAQPQAEERKGVIEEMSEEGGRDRE